MNPRGVLTLLIPRPFEALVKGPIILMSAVLASLSPISEGASWSSVAAGFIAFELLAYQARYLLNDVIDWTEDEKHPAAETRMRLRGLSPNDRPLVYATILGRVAVAVAIAFLISNAWLVVAISGIFVIALPYEALRHHIRRSTATSTTIHRTLYGVVGFGYGLRIVTGAVLGGIEQTEALVLLAVFGVCFGSMFITMFWTLEATVLFDPHDPQREIVNRSHVIELGRYVFVADQSFNEDSRVLLLPPSSANTPWVIGTALALGTASLAGQRLVEVDRAWTDVVLAAIITAGGLVLALSPLAKMVVLALILLGVSTIFNYEDDVTAWMLASGPLAIAIVTHIFYRTSTAAQVGLRRPAVSTG